ncbi:Ig-like domain-containing protein, partial [Desulfobacterales bacterium HSG16]|nr:Ig-like domain-containing protein [Desulfobacterales bacterium HSG16]
KNITIFKLENQSWNQIDQFSADDSNRVTMLSERRVQITPTNQLVYGDYYVKIESGAFGNGSGNFYAGIDDETTWKFTYRSPIPTVELFLPADEGNILNATDNLEITFDRNVDLQAGGSITIYKSGSSESETITLPDLGKVTVASKKVTINPATPFVEGSSYYVKIASNTICDSSDTNYCYEIDNATTWNFSFPSITSLPEISQLSPVDDSVMDQINTLQITFNKNVIAKGGNITIYNSNGPVVFDTIASTDNSKVTVINKIVTIDPQAPFATGNEYYVLIDGDAFDDGTGADKYFAGINSPERWNFTFDLADGDMSGDGTPNLTDVIIGLQVLAGIDPVAGLHHSAWLADVDGDKVIGIEEVIFVLRYLAFP